ncbi:hypothetical protein ACFPL7_22340 [Dongia soli]|uniref:Uncharacterized protein n=1 Tax=Dongia soli TaxID=600628 RepID=A0ABU5E7P5_9PROT|nr:hypothetical protein [Dongia soli]MDY0882331.1 hypothetical protein [Dongia soli]
MRQRNPALDEDSYFKFVFEGSFGGGPGENPRFVEVENSRGESVILGEWVETRDGLELRLAVRRVGGRLILQVPEYTDAGEWIEIDETDLPYEEPDREPDRRNVVHFRR